MLLHAIDAQQATDRKRSKLITKVLSPKGNHMDCVFETDLVDNVVRALEADIDVYYDSPYITTDISYFLYDLDFGRSETIKWTDTDYDATIVIDTPEKLYDYLAWRRQQCENAAVREAVATIKQNNAI